MNQDTSSQGERLLSCKEVMKKLNCGRSALKKYVAQGLVPKPIRLGRKLLWPASEIDAWIRAGAPPAHVWEHKKKQAYIRV